MKIESLFIKISFEISKRVYSSKFFTFIVWVVMHRRANTECKRGAERRTNWQWLDMMMLGRCRLHNRPGRFFPLFVWHNIRPAPWPHVVHEQLQLLQLAISDYLSFFIWLQCYNKIKYLMHQLPQSRYFFWRQFGSVAGAQFTSKQSCGFPHYQFSSISTNSNKTNRSFRFRVDSSFLSGWKIDDKWKCLEHRCVISMVPSSR